MQILQEKMSVHAPKPNPVYSSQLRPIPGRLGCVGPDFRWETWASSLVAWREWCFAVRESFVGLSVNQNALPVRFLV
jgi:hypothetical protein